MIATFLRRFDTNFNISPTLPESVMRALRRGLWQIMVVHGYVSLSAVVLALCATAANSADVRSRPMNVVMILVDDLGWSDLSCYASEYHRSPAIDRLASGALRFTQAYAPAPVCTPTRAALLTGKHPARLDMTIWHEGAAETRSHGEMLAEGFSRPNLSREETTLAELCREAGYATIHVGKWHLGTSAYYPENHGFDVNVGGAFWGAPATFFHPFGGYWNATNPEPRYVPGLGLGEPDDYLTDRLTDVALESMRACQKRPFFLNLWYYSVHSPIEAPPKLVERIRNERPLGTRQKSPTYAAMIERLDANVDRVLTTLDELGLTDSTVVILASDNGGVDIPVRGITPTSNAPLRSGKGTLYEGGIRVPLIVRWPGRTRANSTSHHPVVLHDLFPTLANGLDLQPATTPDPTIDGVNLLPEFADPNAALERDTLYWHFPHYYPRATPCSAMRQGNWKLIHFYEHDALELYDLANDPSESRNLAGGQSSKAANLKRQLDQWRLMIGANGPRRR